jgi:hypothetical protein
MIIPMADRTMNFLLAFAKIITPIKSRINTELAKKLLTDDLYILISLLLFGIIIYLKVWLFLE